MKQELRKQDAADIFRLLEAAADRFGDKVFLKYEEAQEVFEKSYRDT